MAGWVNKKEVLYEPNDRLMIPNGAVFDHPTDLMTVERLSSFWVTGLYLRISGFINSYLCVCLCLSVSV